MKDQTLKELAAEWGENRVTLTAYCRSHGIRGPVKRHEIVDYKGKTRWTHSMFLSPAQADKLRRLRGHPGKGD